MKLFSVWFMDGMYDSSYLTTGHNKEEVKERETNILEEECDCLIKVFVSEISEVDGYKIELVKK